MILSSLFAVASIAGGFALPSPSVHGIDVLSSIDRCLESPTSGSVSFSCLDSEQEFGGGQSSFSFRFDGTLMDFGWKGEASVTDHSLTEGGLEAFVSVPLGQSQIDFTFDFGDEVIPFSLYFAESEGIYHSSALSSDVAARAAGYDLGYEIVEETEDGAEDGDRGIRPLGIGASGRIYGDLKWTDDQGRIHPLVGAKVQIDISGSVWHGFDYTDDTGHYDISYSDIWYLGSGKPTIRFYSEGEHVSVSSGGGSYAKGFSFDSNATRECSYTFSVAADGDSGRAMHLLQMGVLYSREAMEMTGQNSFQKCIFYYPHMPEMNDPEGSVQYNNNSIMVAPLSLDSEYPSSYAAWDVIGHEYGHHVAETFNLFNNPGGRHLIGQNIIDQLYMPKGATEPACELSDAYYTGIRLAWAEAWPTYWSIAAQKSFPAEFKTIKTVGDTIFTSHKGFSYDLDSFDVIVDDYLEGTVKYPYEGEGNEAAISCILYKLSSSEKSGHDLFAIPRETLWEIVRNANPAHLSDFVNALCAYKNGVYSPSQVGYLISQYGCSSAYMSIVSGNYLDLPPTFQWSDFSGSKYAPYDSFELVFEDADGSSIFSIDVVRSNSYALSQEQWRKLLASNNDYYRVRVISRMTSYGQTGPYWSQDFYFKRPTEYSGGKGFEH